MCVWNGIIRMNWFYIVYILLYVYMYVNYLGLVCLYVFDVVFDICILEIFIGEVVYIIIDKYYIDCCLYIN